MITVVETSTKTKTLSTPDDVAAFLKRHHRILMREAKFKHGDVVKITSRAGIPPDICIGDRVVFLFEAIGGHTANVLGLNSGGKPVPFPVQLSSLAAIENVEVSE